MCAGARVWSCSAQVRVHVGTLQVRVHACLWKPKVNPRRRPFADIPFCCRLIFKAESLTGLELAQWAGLAVQQAPGSSVSTSPALELEVHTPMSPSF